MCALLHLCASIEKCGPLWATSAFVFESKIGQLRSYAKGPTRVGEQISDRILQYYAYRNKLITEMSNPHYTSNSFCEQLFFNTEHKSGKIKIVDKNITLYTDFCNLKDAYSRCRIRETLYCFRQYKLAKKTDDTVAMLKDRRFIQINHFYMKNNEVFIDIFSLITKPYKIEAFISKNTFIVTEKRKGTVKASDVTMKLVHVHIPNVAEYVIIPPPMYDIK